MKRRVLPVTVLVFAFGCSSDGLAPSMVAVDGSDDPGSDDPGSDDPGPVEDATDGPDPTCSSSDGGVDVEKKRLVAHRGASAYAPEHTREAYQLALDQGADFLEPDLQITQDGALVAFHDLTLNRTTNVETVFPDRYREETIDGSTVQHWYVNDFTLEEIRTLDAGSWFDERFRGASVMTLAEVIEMALGRAGIFPEIKSPDFYLDRGHDMNRLLIAELERFGLHEDGAVPETPVIVQSFSAGSLRTLRDEHGSNLPITLLVGRSDSEGWLTPEGLARAAAFATGIGPSKSRLLAHPSVVELAHNAGMTVIPYTFRSSNTGNFPNVTAEMAHFLYELGVDGVFTDNPDLFPRTPPDGL